MTRSNPGPTPVAQGAVASGRGLTAASGPQRLVILGWHPRTSANRSHDHWRKIQQAHHQDRDTVYIAAVAAGWHLVYGRVRLTITLVYPRKYRVDADNLAARCKGLIDGLKKREVAHPTRKMVTTRAGFFYDDSTEHLELIVRAEVRPGVKATELLLESTQ